MRILLGATAALALADATPVAAMTLVFNVQVTGVNQDVDFIPFSFQETWTWNPTDLSSGGSQLFQGPASVTPESQVTANQVSLARVDLAGSSTTTGTLNVIGTNTLFFGLSQTAQSDEVIDPGQEKGGADDTHALGFYSRSIGLSNLGLFTFPAFDAGSESEFRAFLTGRTLNWFESARLETAVGDGPYFFPLEGIRTYSGTATLVVDQVAGVPEPAAWALMIGGFGGVGATLRRRRTAAVA